MGARFVAYLALVWVFVLGSTSCFRSESWYDEYSYHLQDAGISAISGLPDDTAEAGLIHWMAGRTYSCYWHKYFGGALNDYANLHSSTFFESGMKSDAWLQWTTVEPSLTGSISVGTENAVIELTGNGVSSDFVISNMTGTFNPVVAQQMLDEVAAVGKPDRVSSDSVSIHWTANGIYAEEEFTIVFDQQVVFANEYVGTHFANDELTPLG